MSDAPRDQMHMQGIDPLHGQRFLVRKRDGRIEEFNEARILIAIESAFKAHHGLGIDDPLPVSAQAAAKHSADEVVERGLAAAKGSRRSGDCIVIVSDAYDADVRFANNTTTTNGV